MEGRDHNGLGRDSARRWEGLELDLKGGEEELGHSRQGPAWTQEGVLWGWGIVRKGTG